MEEFQPTLRSGRFLTEQEREAAINRRQSALRHRRWQRRLRITALLAADGVLVYMILNLLVDIAYGTMFLVIVSFSIGYNMK